MFPGMHHRTLCGQHSKPAHAKHLLTKESNAGRSPARGWLLIKKRGCTWKIASAPRIDDDGTR